jgi:hypothetical protein
MEPHVTYTPDTELVAPYHAWITDNHSHQAMMRDTNYM